MNVRLLPTDCWASRLIGCLNERVNSAAASQIKWASQRRNVATEREMWGPQLGTVGCIMDGWGKGVGARGRGGALCWDGLGWGPSEGRAPASGAINAEGHGYGGTLWTQLLPAGCRHQSRQEEKKNERARRAVHPSVPQLLPPSSLHSANPLHTALSPCPDPCCSP